MLSMRIVLIAAMALGIALGTVRAGQNAGTIHNGSAEKIIVWLSKDALQKVVDMKVAGNEPTESDYKKAVACVVSAGTSVNILETVGNFLTIIVSSGPYKGCKGLIHEKEFKAD